jgi:hypothetical protein
MLGALGLWHVAEKGDFLHPEERLKDLPKTTDLDQLREEARRVGDETIHGDWSLSRLGPNDATPGCTYPLSGCCVMTPSVPVVRRTSSGSVELFDANGVD